MLTHLFYFRTLPQIDGQKQFLLSIVLEQQHVYTAAVIEASANHHLIKCLINRIGLLNLPIFNLVEAMFGFGSLFV